MKSESPAIQTLWQIQFLPTARRCFTLIELLVVIAMIAILAAMLLLALFLQFHLSGSSIFGYNSREAVTAVSQSIDLQKVADSVRIK